MTTGWFRMCFLSSHGEHDSASVVRGFAIWISRDQRNSIPILEFALDLHCKDPSVGSFS